MRRDVGVTCPDCKTTLPPGVAAAACPTCEVRASRFDPVVCRCHVPVRDRRYLNTWICRRCAREITAVIPARSRAA